jgi:hypothetical protein
MPQGATCQPRKRESQNVSVDDGFGLRLLVVTAGSAMAQQQFVYPAREPGSTAAGYVQWSVTGSA